ncbi:MAG: RDD family protein [Thermoleophilaceae bacterium]
MAAPAEASRVPTGPALDNRRVAAALIDLVVPGVLVCAAYAAGLALTAAVVLVIAGWTLFYFFALETDGGQTLGKRAMGLRATRPDGRPADTRQVAIRTALRVVDHPFGLVVMAVTGDRRLRLGDLAAGTVVTEATNVSDDGTVADTTAPLASRPPAGAPDAPPPRAQQAPVRPRPPVAPAPMARPAAVGPPPPVPTAPRPAALPSMPRRVDAPQPRASAPATREPAAERPAPIVEPRWDQDPVAEHEPIVEPRWDEDPVAEHEPIVEPLAEPAWYDEPAFDREPVVEPLAEPRAYDDPAELATERLRGGNDQDAEDDPPAPASPHERNEPIVKPIETISAIDLVMQDAERRERA